MGKQAPGRRQALRHVETLRWRGFGLLTKLRGQDAGVSEARDQVDTGWEDPEGPAS